MKIQRINLICDILILGFLLIAAASTVDERFGASLRELMREVALYRDGTTTISGTITSTDGASIKIDPVAGRITCAEIQLILDTSPDETTIKAKMSQGGLRFWRPNGAAISMVFRERDWLHIAPGVAWEDREPGRLYDMIAKVDGFSYLFESRDLTQ